MALQTLLILFAGINRRSILGGAGAHAGMLINVKPPPVVYFYGEVNTETCFKLQASLRSADHAVRGTTVPVHLHIQSFGGDLLPLLSVLDCIDDMNHPLWTFIDGYAASAATVLSVYGQKRFMTSRSVALIHELRASPSGPLSEIENEMRLARGMAREMYKIYMTKTQMNSTTLAQVLDADAWMDARKCIELGIVDEIC
jgi:ATP-dependent Clp protease protease subunit